MFQYLRMKLDSVGFDVTVNQIKIVTQMSMREMFYTQRTVYEKVKKNLITIPETCIHYNILGTTEAQNAWVMERLKQEITMWNVFVEQVQSYLHTISKYAEVLDKQDPEETRIDVPILQSHMEKLKRMAQSLLEVAEMSKQRVSTQFSSDELRDLHFYDDTRFIVFKEIFQLLMKHTFDILNGIKSNFDDYQL